MKPQQVSQQLRRMATYIESQGAPDRRRVVAGLNDVVTRLRTAADVKQFTQKEFDEALGGMDALIGRLNKIVKTMNPQDPVHADLMAKVDAFTQAKSILEKEYQSIDAQV